MADRYARVDGAPYIDWWQAQYGGHAGSFADCTFWQRGQRSIWVAAVAVDPGELTPVDGVGIPFLRTAWEVWKPTSVAAIEFGLDAERNVVDLTAAEAVRFLDREAIEFEAPDPRAVLPNRGYAIARYAGVPIGCGLWRRGGIESAVPKGRCVARMDLPLGAERQA
jgi:NOL1/NOP2/fmu family ribosome biogenesis protein